MDLTLDFLPAQPIEGLFLSSRHFFARRMTRWNSSWLWCDRFGGYIHLKGDSGRVTADRGGGTLGGSPGNIELPTQTDLVQLAPKADHGDRRHDVAHSGWRAGVSRNPLAGLRLRLRRPANPPNGRLGPRLQILADRASVSQLRPQACPTAFRPHRTDPACLSFWPLFDLPNLEKLAKPCGIEQFPVDESREREVLLRVPGLGYKNVAGSCRSVTIVTLEDLRRALCLSVRAESHSGLGVRTALLTKPAQWNCSLPRSSPHDHAIRLPTPSGWHVCGS